MRTTIISLCLLSIAALIGCVELPGEIGDADIDDGDDDGEGLSDPILYIDPTLIRVDVTLDQAYPGAPIYGAVLDLGFTNDGPDTVRDVDVISVTLHHAEDDHALAELVECPAYSWDHDVEPNETEWVSWLAWREDVPVPDDGFPCGDEVSLSLTVEYAGGWTSAAETESVELGCQD